MPYLGKHDFCARWTLAFPDLHRKPGVTQLGDEQPGQLSDGGVAGASERALSRWVHERSAFPALLCLELHLRTSPGSAACAPSLRPAACLPYLGAPLAQEAESRRAPLCLPPRFGGKLSVANSCNGFTWTREQAEVRAPDLERASVQERESERSTETQTL